MVHDSELMIDVLRKEIEDLQNQQQELVSKFNDKNNEIEAAVAEYNAKITKLQREGQELVDRLDNEREQLRGSYQTFKKLIADKQVQLDKYLEADNEDDKNEDSSKNLEKKPEKVKRTRTTKTTDKEEIGLTEEQIIEIEKLSNKTEEVKHEEKISNDQNKQSDIPEYLKDEYKKLK